MTKELLQRRNFFFVSEIYEYLYFPTVYIGVSEFQNLFLGMRSRIK